MKLLRNNVVCIIQEQNTVGVRTLVENCPVKMSCHMQFYFVFSGRFKYSLRAKGAMETTAARRALM